MRKTHRFTAGTLSVLATVCGVVAEVQTRSVTSPDGTVRMEVRLTDQVYYNVVVDGREVLRFSPLSMDTSHGSWGRGGVLERSEIRTIDEEIATVWGIRKHVPDIFNELQLDFKGGYSILFRAYNDGVAYRFRCDRKGELVVHGEEVAWRFPQDGQMVNLVLDSFSTSYEKPYTWQRVSGVQTNNLVGLPSIVRSGGVFLSIMEADVFGYPGLYLTRKGAHQRPWLNGAFATYPLRWELGGTHNFDMVVKERAEYMAKTEGPRAFPWRVIGIAREDRELADSDLVYKLSRPAKIETDWIEPGLVAWDWWNAMNLTRVDFEAGINTRTYEYFIDFAARNGIPYVILDEGWSDPFDLMLLNPEVDVEHLAQYAREKGVRLILWAIAYAVEQQREEAFALFEKWGVAGVKIDFIDRDDQQAIAFYEETARAAANHRLLVDYHGASKPTGLHRTYPNVVNFEAVRGNEYNKFSDIPTDPAHNVTLAFTRMMAGPLDYTPGALRNAAKGGFATSFDTPMGYGTRAHQLGMFVVYYAPLQMLCDAPTAYERVPDILSFISGVPVSWDDTRVLAGTIGEYVVIARRKGDVWYVGGLNNWTERTVRLDLSKLGLDGFKATILRDGINANRDATDYVHETRLLEANTPVPMVMKSGGGFVMRLEKTTN